MHHFTTDLIQALVTKQDVTGILHIHLEKAMNQLFETELTAFLYYKKYDRVGIREDGSKEVLSYAIAPTESAYV